MVDVEVVREITKTYGYSREKGYETSFPIHLEWSQ